MSSKQNLPDTCDKTDAMAVTVPPATRNSIGHINDPAGPKASSLEKDFRSMSSSLQDYNQESLEEVSRENSPTDFGDSDQVFLENGESQPKVREEKVQSNGLAEKSRRRSSILSKSGRPRKVKKSVSFCSMPTERRVANARDCLACMQEGTELTKLKPNGRMYRRYYWLENDLSEIRWMPTSKTYNKAKILVSQIKEVQNGKNSEAMKNKDVEMLYQEECMLTILYGNNYTPLDLVAKSPDEANIWLAGLNHLIAKQDDLSNGVDGAEQEDPELKRNIRDRWLTEIFIERSGSVVGVLPESEVIRTILGLSPAVDTQYIHQRLKELYSTDRSNAKGMLNCDEFISLYKDVASRQEIYFLMTKYGNSNDYMNAEELMLFLETEQGICDMSKSCCEKLIIDYEPSREGKAKILLGIDGLLAYLLSDTCDIFNSRLHAVTQDMDQPLSHYFINSSHKTYLLEDQLKGPSSVAAYTRVLKQGCRYIEIDCWDGPTEPIVYHGRTLTSKILFADVISTVNEYAFLSSPYPLIVSLENHCCLEQQRVIVDILKTKLGDKLYTTPINGNTFALPSPNQLKYKILIKCKKIEDSSDIISAHGYVSEEDNSVEADWKKITRKEPSKQMPMLRELSDLVIWCQSSSLEQFAQHGQSQKPWHVTSMSDTLVHRLMESSSALMEERVACNRHCLARVYPSCSKVDSSNYNPQPMWNCGFQIVALNQQTQGLDTDLNIARFKSNGSCGYVLKPAILRQPSAVFNPEATGPLNLPGVVPRVIQLKVISGHRFPKPLGSTTKSSIIDPYVLIEMFGIRADCANFRTKTVPGNGQNPFFDESFTFYTHFPEMALLKFTVLDDEFIGDEFIAQYTIPVDCINTGYRHINLLSSAGNKLAGCTLFVHITATHGADKKPMRRGNSTLNRLRVVKEAIAIKLVGIKAIDDTTKCLINNLSELAELKFNVETALIKFKEACDVGSVANIKYCVRTIANRACNAKGLTIKLVKSSGLPTFIISDGTPPDILKKALQAYLAWCKECKTLIDNGEPIRKTLLEIQALLRTIQSEMNSYVEEANLSEKKSQKALENFSWNMRVLKEQLTSLDQYTETCHSSFLKVIEAAQVNGVEVMTETES